MIANPRIAAQQFLQKLGTRDGKELLESTEHLLQSITEKEDPDNVEILIAASLYKVVEGLQSLRGNLKSYVKEKQTLLGDKISELYGDDDTVDSI